MTDNLVYNYTVKGWGEKTFEAYHIPYPQGISSLYKASSKFSSETSFKTQKLIVSMYFTKLPAPMDVHLPWFWWVILVSHFIFVSPQRDQKNSSETSCWSYLYFVVNPTQLDGFCFSFDIKYASSDSVLGYIFILFLSLERKNQWKRVFWIIFLLMR